MMDVDPNVRERLCAQRMARKANIESSLSLNSHNNFFLLSGDLAKNLKGKSLTF
jgi:hypothetical protein